MKKLISLCALFALTTVMAFAADVTGSWKGEANPNGKGGPPNFTFKQDGSTLIAGKTFDCAANDSRHRQRQDRWRQDLVRSHLRRAERQADHQVCGHRFRHDYQ